MADGTPRALFVMHMRRWFGNRAMEVAQRQCEQAVGEARASWQRIVADLDEKAAKDPCRQATEPPPGP